MKTKIAIILLVWLGMASQAAFAQNENAAGAAAKAETPAKPGDVDADRAADAGVQDLIKFTEDTSLGQVIKTLASRAGTNIMIDPSLVLASNTSPGIKFEKVTPLEALEAILANNSLIMIGDPRTRIARITKQPAAPPPITAVFQLKYSNPTNLAEIITKTFAVNKATAFPEPRTSQLVVSALPHDMEEITNMIARLDQIPRQVLIMARIIETSKNPQELRGVDWTGTLEAQAVSYGNGIPQATFTSTPGIPTTTTTTLPSGRPVTTTTTSGSIQSLAQQVIYNGAGAVPGISLNSASGLSPNMGFLSANGLSAVMSFLNKDTDTRVVSTPRTVTLDNEPATLSVTKAFPIFKITPGSANSPAGADVTWTNLGTILQVTPHIGGDDRVTLKISPEVSNIDSKDTQVINGQQNSANVYASRKIEAKVLIHSGETLVVGGLISDQKTKNSTGVPILKDIPGLGNFFKHSANSVNQQNLIIFITPTIVKDSDFTKPSQTDMDFLRTPAPEEEPMTPKDELKKKK